MKKIVLFLILISSQVQAGGLLKKIDLSLCDESGSRCVRLLSNQGKSTQLTTLFVLESPLAIWTEREGRTTEKRYSSGYIDFANDQIVLRGFQEEEFSISLKTLQQREVVAK